MHKIMFPAFLGPFLRSIWKKRVVQDSPLQKLIPFVHGVVENVSLESN